MRRRMLPALKGNGQKDSPVHDILPPCDIPMQLSPWQDDRREQTACQFVVFLCSGMGLREQMEKVRLDRNAA